MVMVSWSKEENDLRCTYILYTKDKGKERHE
jgi:hypothetical protein